MWYLPKDYFELVRDQIFPMVDTVNVRVDPIEQMNREKQRTVNMKRVKKSERRNDIAENTLDADYEEFKDNYSDRMVDYEDEDNMWVAQKQNKGKGQNYEEFKDIIVEYEAVKRLESKTKSEKRSG